MEKGLSLDRESTIPSSGGGREGILTWAAYQKMEKPEDGIFISFVFLEHSIYFIECSAVTEKQAGIISWGVIRGF